MTKMSNGCIAAQASVTVKVNPIPTVSATSPISVCAGSTINLSASGGSTYSWTGPGSFSSTAQNPSRASMISSWGGTYNVTTISNGCISAPVSVAFTGNRVSTFVAPRPFTVSAGSPLNLSASGGSTYSWT